MWGRFVINMLRARPVVIIAKIAKIYKFDVSKFT